MKLITAWNSTGKVAQCDARCYDAKSGRCACCCGGANHGVGIDQAISNVRDWFTADTHNTPLDQWLAAQPPGTFLDARIPLFRLPTGELATITPAPAPQEPAQDPQQPNAGISLPPLESAPTAHQEPLQPTEAFE